jgi:hypothetical protein
MDALVLPSDLWILSLPDVLACICALTHIARESTLTPTNIVPNPALILKSLIYMCDSAHTIILLLLTLTLSKDLAVVDWGERRAVIAKTNTFFGKGSALSS